MTGYAIAVLLSAFLLFQIQPAIAKAILPWFGGTPAVWTTCLLFFQALLVAGYGYADAVTTRLRPRTQVAVHGALVGAAAIFALPLAVDPSWKPAPTEDPTLEILSLLAVTVGLPYFVLSSTSPLVQAWAARVEPTRSPYPLYALSNLGSIAGLLTYPFLVEPHLTTLGQLRSWSAGFAIFALITLAVGVRASAAGLAEPFPRPPRAASTPVPVRLLWLTLPACGSIVLLAVTNRICREVAVAPFLWVLPLSVYLATFIVTFASDRWYRRRIFLPALFVASLPVAFGFAANNLDLKLIVSFHATLLFAACMVCHGELARLRPDPARLTSFYLASSLGGASGAAFVAVGAPRIFDVYLELQFGILLALLLPPVVMYRESPERFRKRRAAWFVWIQASAAIAALMWFDTRKYYAESHLLRRNFFGTLRVVDTPEAPGGAQRFLIHGTTSHGLEFLDPARHRLPTSYYAKESGAGRLLAALDSGAPRRIGVIGLGVGTLAADAKLGDDVWFYEINPLVIEVARAEFHYLREAAANIHVELGDARLALEAEAPRGFDALFADAFSSDAIPMHLLTIEAFGLYFRHLKPDGVLAVHLSNRALDLRPVVAAAAEELGKEVVFIESRGDRQRGLYASLWALVSANRALLDRIRSAAPPPKTLPVARVLWTDDFTSLFAILK